MSPEVDKLLRHNTDEKANHCNTANGLLPEQEVAMQNGSGVIGLDEDAVKSKANNDCSITAESFTHDKKQSDNEISLSVTDNGEMQRDDKTNIPDSNLSVKYPPLNSKLVQSSITRCILIGNHRLLLECLKQGEDPNALCPDSGRTYLHLIAQVATADRELTWVPMIYQLSNAGSSMTIEDKVGMTSCGLAISKKLVQILSALLKCGAELREADWFQAEQTRGVVKAEMLEIMRRLSPSYWSAIHHLTPFKVNRLVKAWSRVNVTRNGQTLIEYAKQTARDESIIKLLLHHEASIELAHAVMAGDKERVQTLLCDGAIDFNTSDTSVKNNSFEPIAPLTLHGAAIKLGHVEILNELIAAKERRKYSSASLSSSTSADDGKYYSSYDRGGRSMQDNNPTVIFYKGSSNEEVCQIRTMSKPVTSALCSIL